MCRVLEFLILVLICVTHNALATDPVLDPPTLDDNLGNTADEDSVITWVDMPGGKYKANKKYDDGQLEGFLNMKDGFIKTLQSKMLDKTLISDVLLSEISFAEAGRKVGVFLIGFAICLVIGILFLLLFPLIGCCFCCCRLCGNCGGKRVQKEPSSCKCICLTITLDITITIIFVGCMMAVMMNDRMSFSIDYLDDAISDNVDDMGTFLNQTANEVEWVALGGFNFTIDVLRRDLDNIDYTLGLPIRNYLGNDLGVYQILDDTIAMDTTIDNTIVQMQYVDSNQTEWEATMTDLESALSDLRTLLDDANYLDHASCRADTDCDALYNNITLLTSLADTSAMTDMTSYITSLQTIQNNNDLTASVESGRQTFDDIPEQLKNDTANEVNDALNDLNSFYSDINDNLADIGDLKQSANDVDNIKEDLDKYLKTIKDYDSYRSAGFIASVALIFFITSLWLIGVIIGPCCYKKETPPTERNCCSNCAGLLLMAAAGLAWIFSVLFMLITVILFMLGYPMHKFICEPFTDPEYGIFDPLLDGPGGLLAKEDNYFMGKLIFNNGSIDLGFSDVLENCRKNKAAYEALQLQHLIDLDQITDWEDSMNLTSIFDDMSTDISDVEIMTNETEDILIDMRDTLSALDYNAMKTVLTTDITATDLSDYAANLRASAAGFSDPLQSNLNSAADELDSIIANNYSDAVTAQSNEYDSVVLLEDIAGDIPTDIDELIADSNEVENNLTIYGDDYVSDTVSDFADKEIGVVNSFVDYVVDQFKTKMAKCLPIWNLWDTLLVNGICDLTVGTLNGVWFAFGWCTFFMFLSIIFSIKLAKYFRKMKYEDGEEEEMKDEENAEVEDLDAGPQHNSALPEKQMSGPAPAASNFGPSTSKDKFGAMGYPNSPPPPYPGARPKPTAAVARNLNF